jgi:nucleoside-diphosphate-sugar epimerase
MGSDLVLVTGASGYVAGHCILRLLKTGRVFCGHSA